MFITNYRHFEYFILGSEYKRLQFICKVTVTGHNYIGLGNSNKKKSAQLDASKDYLLYLTRQGLVSTDSLPSVSSLI